MKSKLVYLCSSMSWGGLEMNQLRNAGWMAARGHDELIVACINSPFLLQAQKMNLPVALAEKLFEIVSGKHTINSHDLRQHVRQFDHLTVCTRVEERFINH
jgi:hypothetical protein